MTGNPRPNNLQALIAEGNFSAALGLARTLLADDSRDIVAILAAADMSNKVGDRQAATAFYEDAIRLDPKNYWARFNLSRLLIDLAAYDKALALADSLTADYPDDYAAVAIRAQIYASTRRHELATEVYEHFLLKHPLQDMAWVSLGDMHQTLRNDARAIACYQKACGINAHNFWARRNLGLLLFDLGVYERALGFLGEALGLSPNQSFSTELDRAMISARFYSSERSPELTDNVNLASPSGIDVITNEATFDRAHGALHVSISLVSARLAIQAPHVVRLLVSDLSVFSSEFVYPTIAVRRQAFVHSWQTVCVRFYVLTRECPETALIQLALPDGTLFSSQVQIRSIDSSVVGTLDTKSDSQDLAEAHYAVHDFRLAAFFYSQALSNFAPIDIDHFILSLLHSGRYHEAEWQMERLLANPPPEMHRDARGRLLDMYCCEIARARLPGYVDKIANVCSDQISRFGETPFTTLNLAHCAIERGETNLALRLYEQASDAARDVSLTHFSMGIHSILSTFEHGLPDLAEYKFHECGSLEGIDLVHLFACDQVYFQRFARSLIASSTQKSAGNVRIHVHIVGANELTFETISSLRAEFRFSFSYEALPNHETLSSSNVRTYYTCARFLIAEKLLARYQKPILITEADCLLNWHWDDVMDWVLAKTDVGLHISGLWSLAPSTKIPAGIMYIDSDRKGSAFLEYVADYIRMVMWKKGTSHQNLWTLDQVAPG
ncbi:MAG: tetratricopeptide repeat protein [Usitatibacteraceae bacterium]